MPNLIIVILVHLLLLTTNHGCEDMLLHRGSEHLQQALLVGLLLLLLTAVLQGVHIGAELLIRSPYQHHATLVSQKEHHFTSLMGA